MRRTAVARRTFKLLQPNSGSLDMPAVETFFYQCVYLFFQMFELFHILSEAF